MQVRVDREGERGSQFVVRGRGVDSVVRWLVLGALLGACLSSCVKVTTGATSEEALRVSEDVASRIRTEWAQQMRTASPSQKVRMLRSLCLKVADSYIGIGYQAVEKWRVMEDLNDETVPDTYIKKMLDDWIVTERPVFTAYDDNIRYALGEIEASGGFEKDIVESLASLVKHYEKVTLAAFNPVGSPDDYEYILEQLEYETERVGAVVGERLQAL